MQGAFSMKVSPCCFINSKNQSWGLCAASRDAFSWAWLFVSPFAASGYLQLGFWAGFAELPTPLKLCGESQSFAGCMDWCSSVQLCELEPSPQGIPRSRALPSSTSGLTSAAAAPVGSCKCYKHTHGGQSCSAASRAHPATHMPKFPLLQPSGLHFDLKTSVR